MTYATDANIVGKPIAVRRMASGGNQKKKKATDYYSRRHVAQSIFIETYRGSGNSIGIRSEIE